MPYRTLATFGCSWTRGVGAQYYTGQNENDYKNSAWVESEIYPHSYRGILSKKFGLTNFNVADGGASNDYNFEMASAIFGDDNQKEKFLKSSPIVLWGITSTARIYRGGQNIFLAPNRETSIMLFLEENYITDPSLEDLKFILNDQPFLYQALYLKLYYDHNKEVIRLANMMQNWNDIFEYYNIPVIWFDTFNTHNYYNSTRNLIKNGDLLTQMLQSHNIKFNLNKKWYHLSDWTNDDDRITKGVKHNLLNPYTYHPTQLGHQTLADIISPYIEEKLK
jgi:hypothetical protein